MTISKSLLDKLACPKCRGGLKAVGGREGASAGSVAMQGLACQACNLLYEVRDGIPVMIVEQAKSLSGDRP